MSLTRAPSVEEGINYWEFDAERKTVSLLVPFDVHGSKGAWHSLIQSKNGEDTLTFTANCRLTFERRAPKVALDRQNLTSFIQKILLDAGKRDYLEGMDMERLKELLEDEAWRCTTLPECTFRSGEVFERPVESANDMIEEITMGMLHQMSTNFKKWKKAVGGRKFEPSLSSDRSPVKVKAEIEFQATVCQF